MNQFYGVILYIPAFFTNISGKIKFDTLSFLLSLKSFLIARHSKCILSSMGGSDSKVFMSENSFNKAQISEKVSTLHKSR